MTFDYLRPETWAKCPRCQAVMCMYPSAVTSETRCDDCKQAACPRCGDASVCPPSGTICASCTRAESEQRADRARRRTMLKQVAIPAHLAWASFAAPELHARVADVKAIALAKRFADGRAVLSGATGVGKSTLAACILRHAIESHPKLGQDDRHWRDAAEPRVQWVDSFALVAARATWRLGTEEPPIIATAKQCDALVLDDLGAEALEPYAKTIPEIIHLRHAAMNLTVVTTQMHPEELERRYGSAVVRRLYEGAAKIHVRTAEELTR